MYFDCCVCGIIYWESSQDTSSVSLSFPYHTDKIAHFVVFGLLCLLICWSLSTARIGSKNIYKLILAIGIASLYGMSDEFHQFFTPNRSVEIFDWLADTAGAVTSGLLWQGTTHKRQIKKKLLATEKTQINM